MIKTTYQLRIFRTSTEERSSAHRNKLAIVKRHVGYPDLAIAPYNNSKKPKST